MEHLATVFTITFVVFLAIVSPGPNFFLVASKALSKSRKAGVITSIGVGVGSFIYSILGFLGIAAIVSSSDTAYSVLRYLGGSYLIFLGLSMVFKKKKNDLAGSLKTEKSDDNFYRSFVTGLTTNLSNPKAMVIYVSVFSMSAEPVPLFYRALTCFLIFTISASWYSFVAVSFSNKRVLSFYNSKSRLISGFFASAIVAFGLKIILNGK